MITEENLLDRIDELLKLKWEDYRHDVVGEIYSGTIAIVTQIWGASSAQVDAVKQLREDMQSSKWAESAKASNIVLQCQGTIRDVHK